MSDSVIVMLRYPEAGKAKTRLAAAMGAEKAVDFYRTCAGQVLGQVGKLPADISKYIFFTGDTEPAEFLEWAGPGFTFRQQVGEDLGERLANAFKEVFAGGAGKAIAVASDVPDMAADVISEALEALASCDLVLGPSHDGGYYLVGMRRFYPQLFQDVPWSTPEVTEVTLARAGKLGLTVCLLPTLIDIDNFEDYKMWLSAGANCRARNVGDQA